MTFNSPPHRDHGVQPDASASRPAGRTFARVRIGLFAALLPVLGWACAFSDGIGGDGETTCIDDNECVSPNLCIYGVCAAASALTDVHVEIAPPMSLGLTAQQFLFVDTAESERSDFVLRPEFAVDGVIKGAEDQPVAARVVAVAQTRIPGRTLALSTDTQMDGTFNLQLTEDESYDIRVYPDDESLPPWFRPTLLAATPGAQTRLDVTLPGASAVWTLTGTVVAGEGAGAIGIPELSVRLFDGTRRVSSTAYTDEMGAFAIRVPPSAAGDLILEVRPTEQNPQFPVVLTPVVAEGDADVGEITLGDVLSPVAFEGRVAGPDGTPIVDASIYIYGVIGAGEVRRLILTDASGRFALPLPPGTYDFVVVASVLDASAGMVQLPGVEVSAESDALVVPLEPRSAITGSVIAADGEPVDGATLSFLRRGRPGDQTATDPVLGDASWSFHATTVGGGAYQAALDPGRYRVRVTPPVGTGLPQYTFIADVYAAPEPLLITLPVARNLAGTVRDSDERPISGATVRVFSAVAAEAQQAISLGEGFTDEQGDFGVLVPDLSGASSTDILDDEA